MDFSVTFGGSFQKRAAVKQVGNVFFKTKTERKPISEVPTKPAPSGVVERIKPKKITSARPPEPVSTRTKTKRLHYAPKGHVADIRRMNKDDIAALLSEEGLERNGFYEGFVRQLAELLGSA